MNAKTKLYPLQFKPIPKYRIWGGNKLNEVLNKGFSEEKIGESWEISDVKGDKTSVINGSLKGKTLREISTEFGEDFLGKKVFNDFGVDFPLLIKFIDAKTPLSVQVHPHDDIARERHNSFGKNEMWYIMDADDSAEIIVGFNKELTKESYSNYLENGNVLEVLNKVNTKSGDAFYIPTGRVHAIGSGVLLAEIQQTSDITYRIYDYERVDSITGKQRDLHSDLALDVLDFNIKKNYNTEYTTKKNVDNKLIHSPYFRSNILFIDKEVVKDCSEIDSFIIYMCTKGSLNIDADGEAYFLKKGDTILLPASLNNFKLSSTSEVELIEVYYS
tara:strand:+ start:8321 stop:9310 length:990 start_codon:yes stop_codon:yes gene_type:complete